MTPGKPDATATPGPADVAPVLDAPRAVRRNRLLRSVPGVIGLFVLSAMLLACLGTLFWTLGTVKERARAADGSITRRDTGVPRYAEQEALARHLPPSWWSSSQPEGGKPLPGSTAERRDRFLEELALRRLAVDGNSTVQSLRESGVTPTEAEKQAAAPTLLMGTDALGRSLFIRCLTGGGISLVIGVAAALLSVFLGTLYGGLAGWIGGRVDAVMMRVVDVLYGLPYVLLVVLLAVASDAAADEFESRSRERSRWIDARAREILSASDDDVTPAEIDEYTHARPVAAGPLSDFALRWLETSPSFAKKHGPGDARPPTAADADAFLARCAANRDALLEIGNAAIPRRDLSDSQRTLIDLLTLLFAIGGISWLTMARVVRGQVLSLKAMPFMEAARAMGVPVHRILWRHLLPNLGGPIIVYATLTVPQAILQESFLSFLGLGVKPPLPSWGSLAADGVIELNRHESHWWLLVFPCLLLAVTLLSLNFLGEGLREALDPKSRKR